MAAAASDIHGEALEHLVGAKPRHGGHDARLHPVVQACRGPLGTEVVEVEGVVASRAVEGDLGPGPCQQQRAPLGAVARHGRRRSPLTVWSAAWWQIRRTAASSGSPARSPNSTGRPAESGGRSCSSGRNTVASGPISDWPKQLEKPIPASALRSCCSTGTGMIDAPENALRSEPRSRVESSGWAAKAIHSVGAGRRSCRCAAARCGAAHRPDRAPPAAHWSPPASETAGRARAAEPSGTAIWHAAAGRPPTGPKPPGASI